MTDARAMKKIVVCEDHRIVYDGLALLLDKNPDYQIAAHASTGRELLPLLAQHQPDILILDLNLPDTDGFALLKEIRKKNTSLLIIILTMYHDPFLIEKAKEEGANSYLLKNTGNEELLYILGKVKLGSFYVSKEIQLDLDRKKMFRDKFAQKMKLTRREVEIIQLLARGKTAPEIATELFLSTHTVETHRKNIFRKLEISSIIELINFVHDNEIL